MFGHVANSIHFCAIRMLFAYYLLIIAALSISKLCLHSRMTVNAEIWLALTQTCLSIECYIQRIKIEQQHNENFGFTFGSKFDLKFKSSITFAICIIIDAHSYHDVEICIPFICICDRHSYFNIDIRSHSVPFAAT